MQLNLTTGYAIRMVVCLASSEERIVPSKTISEETQISQKYLIRIGGKLKSGQIVDSTFGAKGGFFLMRPAGEISLYDVVSLMENTIKIHPCLELEHFDDKSYESQSSVYRSFAVMQRFWENFLNNVTIADLLEDIEDTDLIDRIVVRDVSEHPNEMLYETVS